MMRCRLALVLVPLLAWTTLLEAQVADGDQAWEAGRFGAAKAAYERALATDPASVHALYRLAVLASWRGALDSSLALIRAARRAEPADPDVRLLQAQVLSWQGRLSASVLQYDSVIADNPERLDAQLARARVLAWANRFDEAEAGFRAVLARDPGNPGAMAGVAQVHAWRGDLTGAIRLYEEALARDRGNEDAQLGLAQVHFWQGRVAQARSEVRTVLRADSTNHDAQVLARAIQQVSEPSVDITSGWSNDSDHNTSWWEAVQLTAPLTDHVAVFGSVGLQQTTDPLRRADRASGEAGLRVGIGRLAMTAAAGARRLSPDTGASTTSATWRGNLALTVLKGFTIGTGYSHYIFDETAQLIGEHLTVDQLEGTVDVAATSATTVSAGGGRAWFSDDNRRYHVLAAVSQALPGGFFVGAYGRQMGYDFKGTGYFSPGRFRLAEGRAGWTHESNTWTSRLAGGLGAQEPFRGAATQAEWHLDATVGRKWGVANAVHVFGSLSNSLERSATGAYRYRTAGIRVTLGL